MLISPIALTRTASRDGHVQFAPNGGAVRRVLMVTYHFPPALEIGGQACAQIGRHLPLYGWDPVVLTIKEHDAKYPMVPVAPDFPGSVIRTRVIPHPFMLYRRLKAAVRPEQRWSADGQIWSGRVGVLKRWVGSILALPDLYTGWILPAVIAGLGIVQERGTDYLFSSGPPWTSHIVGLMLARLTGLPWAAHFRDPWTDPWPETHRSRPVTGLSARIETALERMVVRRADAVVCVTEEHTALLRQAHPQVPSSRFVTIPNGFDGAEWEGSDGQAVPAVDKFTITYAGNLYGQRDPTPVFRALRSLIDSGEIAPERVQVDFISLPDGAPGRRVIEMAEACGVGACLSLIGPLSRAETLRRMAQSALLLLLAEGLAFQIPGKTYEYLRAGRPMLALTSDGAVARLLRRTGGAWIVDPASGERVTAALREAYSCWAAGRCGPTADQAILAGFDRRILAGRFAQLFEQSLAARTQATSSIWWPPRHERQRLPRRQDRL